MMNWLWIVFGSDPDDHLFLDLRSLDIRSRIVLGTTPQGLSDGVPLSSIKTLWLATVPVMGEKKRLIFGRSQRISEDDSNVLLLRTLHKVYALATRQKRNVVVMETSND